MSTLLFAGDVSFARDIRQHAMTRFGGNLSYVFRFVQEDLQSADITVANLESALWPDTKPAPGDSVNKAY